MKSGVMGAALLAAVSACALMGGAQRADAGEIQSTYIFDDEAYHDSYYGYQFSFDTTTSLISFQGSYYADYGDRPSASFYITAPGTLTRSVAGKDISLSVVFDQDQGFSQDDYQYLVPYSFDFSFYSSVKPISYYNEYTDGYEGYHLNSYYIYGRDLTFVPLPSSILLFGGSVFLLASFGFVKRRGAMRVQS